MNKTDVINALYLNGESTVKQLTQFVNFRREKERKKPISSKTVERALKDPRVVKNKTRYRINEKAQYEIRYRKPENFGRELLYAAFKNFPRRSIVNRKDWTISKREPSKIMDEYIRRFGAMVIFAFSEAARPFDDKLMTILERDRLVKNWIRNAIPIEEMFYWFQAEFAKSDERSRPRPANEIERTQLDEIFQIFKKSNPKLYKNFILATQIYRKERAEWEDRFKSVPS